jgi:hypothetical protein
MPPAVLRIRTWGPSARGAAIARRRSRQHRPLNPTPQSGAKDSRFLDLIEDVRRLFETTALRGDRLVTVRGATTLSFNDDWSQTVKTSAPIYLHAEPCPHQGCLAARQASREEP